MGLFKKKPTMKDTIIQSLIKWDEGFYNNRATLTSSAESEGEYRLTSQQNIQIWQNLEFYYLIQVYLFANQYAATSVDSSDIGGLVAEIYLSYLVHQKGMSKDDALQSIENKYVKFSEALLNDATLGAEKRAKLSSQTASYEEVLNVASEQFCKEYAYLDIESGEKRDSSDGDIYQNGMFASERIAFKLAKATYLTLHDQFNGIKIA